jgi:integrase
MKLRSVEKDGINETAFIVVDDFGVPIDRICRFTVIENDGKSDDYQEGIARSLIHIEKWAQKNSSIEEEMFDGCFSDGEIFTSLIRHLERYSEDTDGVRPITPRIIQPEYFNQRIDRAIAYFSYYLNKALSKRRADALHTKNLEKRADKLFDKLRDKKRPITKGTSVKGLSIIAQASLYNGLDEPKLFGWNQHTRLRNKMIIRLFYETGIRKGELMSLTIENCHTSKLSKGERPFIHTMENVKYQDPRRKKPHEKTRNRIIPISQSLCKLINEYKILRNASEAAKRQHPFLVLSSQGDHPPLSLSGLNGIFATIKEHLPDVKPLGPHRLRHTFFENLDRMMYTKGYGDTFKTKIKNALGGWSPKSKMSENYEKLATEEQCYETLNILHFEIEHEMKIHKFDDVPF